MAKKPSEYTEEWDYQQGALVLPMSFDQVHTARAAAGRRLRKVWLYIGLMFCLMGVLSYAMTANPRAIVVVGIVCLALGLLGSLMVAFGFRDAIDRQPV